MEGQTFIPYTYTYDQFTVFFYGDYVYIGGKEYPIGQSVVDILNLDESVLDEIDRRVREFIPTAQALRTEKTDNAAALAQERLNAVWDVIFSLPVYRDLLMDEESNRHTFQRLMADSEKWAQVQDPTSEGYAIYQGMLIALFDFVDDLRRLRQQIGAMTQRYFEPLKRRNETAYANAYFQFYNKRLFIYAALGEDFTQSCSMEVSFVPMQGPKRHEKENLHCGEGHIWQLDRIFCGRSSIGGWPWGAPQEGVTTAGGISF